MRIDGNFTQQHTHWNQSEELDLDVDVKDRPVENTAIHGQQTSIDYECGGPTENTFTCGNSC